MAIYNKSLILFLYAINCIFYGHEKDHPLPSLKPSPFDFEPLRFDLGQV